MKGIFLLILHVYMIVFNSSSQIINGYTNKLSYRSGENIEFFLNGDAPPLGIIQLLDMNGQPVLPIPGFSGMVTQNITNSESWQDG